MNRIQKYVWLIDTIRRHGRLSFRELSEIYRDDKDMSDDKGLSRATFNRWRDEVLFTFGIEIACDRSDDNRYFINNPDDIERDGLRKWMLDSFAVGNLISENFRLKRRILVDNILSGREYLTPILSAMEQNSVVEIEYRAYTSAAAKRRKVEPYCVKLFENRWYLIGRSAERDRIRIYGLDRMMNVKVLDERFELPADFDAESYFDNYYGIYHPDAKPERIVIRAYDEHGDYLRSLPLHHSQRQLKETDEYIEFDYYLVPTDDFVMRLMSFGALVEVLQPASLRNELFRRHQEVIDFYYGEK